MRAAPLIECAARIVAASCSSAEPPLSSASRPSVKRAHLRFDLAAEEVPHRECAEVAHAILRNEGAKQEVSRR